MSDWTYAEILNALTILRLQHQHDEADAVWSMMCEHMDLVAQQVNEDLAIQDAAAREWEESLHDDTY